MGTASSIPPEKPPLLWRRDSVEGVTLSWFCKDDRLTGSSREIWAAFTDPAPGGSISVRLVAGTYRWRVRLADPGAHEAKVPPEKQGEAQSISSARRAAIRWCQDNGVLPRASVEKNISPPQQPPEPPTPTPPTDKVLPPHYGPKYGVGDIWMRREDYAWRVTRITNEGIARLEAEFPNALHTSDNARLTVTKAGGPKRDRWVWEAIEVDNDGTRPGEKRTGTGWAVAMDSAVDKAENFAQTFHLLPRFAKGRLPSGQDIVASPATTAEAEPVVPQEDKPDPRVDVVNAVELGPIGPVGAIIAQAAEPEPAPEPEVAQAPATPPNPEPEVAEVTIPGREEDPPDTRRYRVIRQDAEPVVAQAPEPEPEPAPQPSASEETEQPTPEPAATPEQPEAPGSHIVAWEQAVAKVLEQNRKVAIAAAALAESAGMLAKQALLVTDPRVMSVIGRGRSGLIDTVGLAFAALHQEAQILQRLEDDEATARGWFVERLKSQPFVASDFRPVDDAGGRAST